MLISILSTVGNPRPRLREMTSWRPCESLRTLRLISVTSRVSCLNKHPYFLSPLFLINVRPLSVATTRNSNEIEKRTLSGVSISRTLTLGNNVEFHDGDFLRVTNIEKHIQGSSFRQVVLRGRRFCRIHITPSLSQRSPNEVNRINYYLNENLASHKGCSIEEITVANILRKVELKLVKMLPR